MIEAKNLVKKYGEVEAVRGVSFEIGKGEIVGLLGPNGAGKTTIMKMLTGYMYPTSGQASLGGFDVVDQAVQVKSILGYLPESTPLYADLNVREYLQFIAGARGIKKEDHAAEIERVTAECGLEKVISRDISELSKGFRQRVGLAQAIIHKPEILILDEPTSGLDPNQIIEIRELISKMGKEKTVILSTHILQEVEAMCNNVLILNEGLIVARGTPEEIAKELRGESLLVLTLKVKNPDGIQASLGSCRSIDKVIHAEVAGDGRMTVKAALKNEEEAEKEIFDWAVREGHIILSMVPEKLSLEAIFTKLTKEGV
ncbi:MAG: ATP-binding cassette domain-containing protein [Spirochaetaceae bacterium]|nr:MAG: ATP-binding cassette domain-containing protein [Spirochaetaceae bacterium]